MADDLEQFLLESYPAQRARVDELRALANEALRTFIDFFLRNPGTWPYVLESGRPPEPPNEVSVSTTAMIAFALGLATGAIRQSSIAPSLGDPLGSEKFASVVRRYNRRAIDCVIAVQADMPRIVRRRMRRGAPRPIPNPPLTDSATFGWDDPFTATWLLELLQDDTEASHQALANDLQTHADQLIARVVAHPESPVLQIREREVVSHAFPLLRVLQLAHTVAKMRRVDVSQVADLSPVRDYMLRRIHLQLSESHIADGGFDAADLVFSLEGWMLTSHFEPDLSVVDEVFRVLNAGQERTPYWRPLRPFKATQQGLVLLPQSVEIANSLLRICNSDALDARQYFSRQFVLLERYTRWLSGRVFRGQTVGPGARTFTGWESEHTYAQDRIHLWQTSQALIFLHHYTAMFQQHVARSLLRLAPLVPKPRPPARLPQPDDPLAAWQDWKKGEPLNSVLDAQSPYRVYGRIEAEFIAAAAPARRRLVSMLLYGPPGTGKSTLAEEIGRALGFPLLKVTPSDFLARGGEAVEARAKAIFQLLAEQRDMVVLFDEIDNLLLDRDSRLYQNQSDVFKLLTPGMLTKLGDLARDGRVIFVVATNYFERIDGAIKRPGRIDAKYLVLPPDRDQRRRLLGDELKLGGDLDSAAEATLYFTYRELSDLVDHVRALTEADPAITHANALADRVREAPPMIRLASYAPRIGAKWDPDQGRTVWFDVVSEDRPWEELALLTYLACQVYDWPDEPRWLPDAVKRALEEHVVRDRDVRAILRNRLEKARGHEFVADLPVEP
jgi:hypothetical protein